MNPDLGTAAAAEADRLTLARTLMREDDALARARIDDGGPWIAVARSKLRRRLGDRRIEIWRVGYEDASGRSVESRLVALVVDRGLCDIEPVVEAAACEWRQTVERTVAAFASARLRRESAIAAGSARPSPAAAQTGLFDRREHRAYMLAKTARDDAASEAAERMASVERSAAIAPTPPEPLLIITGRTRGSAPTGVPFRDAPRS